MSVRDEFMKGLSTAGIVRWALTLEDTNASRIRVVSGKIRKSTTVITAIKGIAARYAGIPVAASRITLKYTVNRITAFSAAGTGISGVGTNRVHVSDVNKLAGSLNQKVSLISY
jgi:hypothetical protein